MLAERSIRFRLTASFAVMLLAALGLFGLATWIAVSVSITKSVDQALANRIDSVGRFLEYTAGTVPPQELPEELKEFAMGSPEGNLLQVLDSKGNALLSSPSAVALARPRPNFSEVTWNGKLYRVLPRRDLSVNGRKYVVSAAANLDQRSEILRRFAFLLLLAIPGVLLIATAGGIWISRRALRPVDEMTEAARAVRIDNLEHRLRVPATGDELQRLAETWNEMLDRLRHSVDMLRQFTADASHELRSPIAFIRAAAEIALRQERTPTAYRDTLGQIHAETERLSRLIEDLLVLARADAGAATLQFSPVDLRALVDAVCRQEQSQRETKQLDIAVHVPPEPVTIKGNDSAIRRLVRVLLDNAMKYTPDGGRIDVSLDRKDQQVELTVRDNGIGIAASDLPYVFDRFYRADKARSRDEGGCGLGLSIAQWIAQCHRAEIMAESGSGNGAVFRVRFTST